jgi:hypothetical protein
MSMSWHQQQPKPSVSNPNGHESNGGMDNDGDLGSGDDEAVITSSGYGILRRVTKDELSIIEARKHSKPKPW